ncbi:MAG: RNA methyltransferase [Bacteroidales bacterium]|jgi:TrmH family RNA methyltransferase|nr:RNA methyltransferase [Bacteroidales bacterium]OJX88964.1 MAG: RNA methyltransferase [Paludibacter sp. 47-17]
MLSKTKISFINALMLKKFRDEHQCFVAEGTRMIRDLQHHFRCRMLVATNEWVLHHNMPDAAEQIVTDERTFQKISTQKQPQGVLAVFEIKSSKFDPAIAGNELVLMLDNVQDPGNLGTIIRIADWFGIHHVVCSVGSADVYNPKTIQATMGALARVNVHYSRLETLLTQSRVPVFGTFLDGSSIYDSQLAGHGYIIMGNEGNGISPEIEKLVTSKLLIPSFPAGQPTSESLNVGVATALICAEFRRRMPA